MLLASRFSPDRLAQVHLLINAAHDSSFPSDHATAAFSVATAALLWRIPGRRLYLLGAVLIALARVYAGAHYPADVVGGAGLGILWAILAFRLKVCGCSSPWGSTVRSDAFIASWPALPAAFARAKRQPGSSRL